MKSQKSDINSPSKSTNNNLKPFQELIRELEVKMKLVFHDREDINKLAGKRGLTPFVLREIMSVNPLSIAVPKEYGGRGAITHETIKLLSTASYESLALSLIFGINTALFLQPVGKYGHEDVKASVFKNFLEHQTMGGLMITEPDFGSDALSMQTHYTEKDDKFHLKGTKHWAGLTGWADYWIVTARKKIQMGQLQRDLDFFVVDVNSPNQKIVVEEVFENLGLYAIPYGRNQIDLEVPAIQKLQPTTTGIKMMLDLLHRSRMQFPGMAQGFMQRMLDEALTHCKTRFVGGKSLLKYDQVQQRLSRLQASYTIGAAMCLNSSKKVTIDKDMFSHGLEANAVKSVITDLMQEAAQSALQLFGAKAFKINHIVGRGTVDSRPFKIFEGSNDILYAQITEGLLKLMRRNKERNLFTFLKDFDLTNQAVHYVKDLMNFNLDMQMPQRKLVEMGRIIGRVISINYVIQLSEKGFRKDLIDGSIVMLQQEISKLMASFSFNNKRVVVEGYQEDSDWFELI